MEPCMKIWTFATAALLVALGARPSFAHFQELLPSNNILDKEAQKTVTLRAVFTHPMEGAPIMNMGPPTAFGVIGRNGERSDLKASLQPAPVGGKAAFTADYTLR